MPPSNQHPSIPSYAFLVLVAVLLATGSNHAQTLGDMNCDGHVNADDLTALTAAIFNDTPGDCTFPDPNGDGTVEGADLTALIGILAPPPTPIPTGPDITFLGVAGANGAQAPPLGRLNGIPVFFHSSGFGFKLVIEGKTGANGLQPGSRTFNMDAHNPEKRPDLQIESSRPLGEGSAVVCDDDGAAAIEPPDFGPTQVIANALNDLACNFTTATAASFACTQDESGNSSFLGTGTQVQFCLQVTAALRLPDGDTTFSVQLRDQAGTVGPLQKIIVRVSAGPMPPTFTPVLNPTPTAARPLRTATATATRTVSPTRTPSRTSTRTASPTPLTPTRSPTAIASMPSATPFTPAATSTVTRTATRTTSATSTRSRTATSTKTSTPTPTPTVLKGPTVTHFGLTFSDNSKMEPTTPGGTLFTLPAGLGGASFWVVVEAKPGLSGAPVGESVYQLDGKSLPDLQVEVNQPLGNGGPPMCSNPLSMQGGVPAIESLSFDPTPFNIDAINGLGCRFLNGLGVPGPRSRNTDPCVMFSDGNSGFVELNSTIQFCASISNTLRFPPGDTVVSARLRDQDGNLGAVSQIVIRRP